MKIRPLFLLTTLCLGSLISTLASAKDYENFRIGPGFGSRIGTGFTGGLRAAGEYGREGYCVGWISNTPDHIIEVTAEVEMTLSVDSDTDSTLVVVYEGSREMCDDDSAGNDDAALSDIFLPGTYEVYVGSYGEEDYGRYTLTIREKTDSRARNPIAGLGQRQPRGPQIPNEPRRPKHPDSTQGPYGSFKVGAGFTPDPQTASGISGYSDDGRVDASTFGGRCTGFIDTTPDHTLTVTSTVNLRLTVSSDIDSTLVVRGPAGTFCDDDSAGNRDAQIDALLTPGDYEVYIGNIGEAGEYILTVTERSQGGYVT